MKRSLMLILAMAGSAPAMAGPEESLRQQVETALAGAPAGTRFGLLVTDDQGREVVAVAPDQRFIPASNTKLFTTAAAYAVLGRDLAATAVSGATQITVMPPLRGQSDVILTGGGGVSLSSAPDCVTRCLSALARAVATRAGRIADVIADDSAFVDQRWSPGMSWNNIQTDSGTATSALIVDDNALPLVVSPAQPGQPAVVTVSPYFTVRNEAQTVAAGETKLAVERAVNARELRIYGTIAAGAPPWREDLGIDDPADYAGWALRRALLASGAKVSGKVVVRHRAARFAASPAGRVAQAGEALVAAQEAAPLDEEVATINKRSQNLHAEALLRRTGVAWLGQSVVSPESGKLQSGSREAGLAALRAVLDSAGVSRGGYDLSDGSGMSTYNRASPRAVVGLLRWAGRQGWGAAWRASLPVGGVDGTLRNRFAGTALAGKIRAKTGTLNATNALSGYMQGASGRELTFSIFANDVPDGGNAVPAMDAALVLIAAAN